MGIARIAGRTALWGACRSRAGSRQTEPRVVTRAGCAARATRRAAGSHEPSHAASGPTFRASSTRTATAVVSVVSAVAVSREGQTGAAGPSLGPGTFL